MNLISQCNELMLYGVPLIIKYLYLLDSLLYDNQFGPYMTIIYFYIKKKVNWTYIVVGNCTGAQAVAVRQARSTHKPAIYTLWNCANTHLQKILYPVLCNFITEREREGCAPRRDYPIKIKKAPRRTIVCAFLFNMANKCKEYVRIHIHKTCVSMGLLKQKKKKKHHPPSCAPHWHLSLSPCSSPLTSRAREYIRRRCKWRVGGNPPHIRISAQQRWVTSASHHGRRGGDVGRTHTVTYTHRGLNHPP